MSGLNRVVAILLAASFLGGGLTGCGKKSDSSSGTSGPANPQQTATSAKAAVIGPAFTAWQQGDKAAAVSRFLETDWSVRPLFQPGSALSLSEAQFKSLSASDREAKASENMAKISELKKMTAAVVAAGRAAAEKKEVAEARKHFTSLKQFGAALDAPESLAILKLVGQSIKKQADKELAALGQ